MDKKQLQTSILEKTYQPEKWLDVMKEYFSAKKFHQKPLPVSLPSNDLAESAVELGSFYTADERLVGMYEVQLKPKAWIQGNRVSLRSLLRQVYKYDVDAALIVFVQADKWRFSYVSEIRTEDGKKETEPKRYTYLFGKGETSRTAADRFDNLKGKPIYLADLFEAFNVEKLNKNFFKTYKEFYQKGVAEIVQRKSFYKLLIDPAHAGQEDEDKKEKPIRDFVKKMLGRIVFLHFLQKKGWMGCPVLTTEKENEEVWTDGKIKFLQELFNSNNNKSNFHSECLKILFFKTLNRKRKNNAFEIDMTDAATGKQVKVRVPYLNGGLFDKDISFENDIDFSADYFKNLLEFFEQYNFTIDENDPYDNEVGIDPEMLGHIFENLLEENKDKGAFYTPKEVVHYMCQESLIQYLRTHLPECTEDESPATIALQNFIHKGETGERSDRKNFVVQQAKRIEKYLDNVKICDPAIGSGAFPMGMLQEIYRAKTNLDLTLDHTEVKKQIIQNCIYGVDIENGAVEIARLRFWLSLVVDETTPHPLPNLDYKIMQGNSLLESFEQFDLKDLLNAEDGVMVEEIKQLSLGSDFEKPVNQLTFFTKANKEELQLMIDKYFDPDSWEKRTGEKIDKVLLKKLINDFVEGKIHAFILKQQRELNDTIKKTEIQWKNAGVKDFENLNHKSKEYKQYIYWKNQLEHLEESEENLVALQQTENKPYFLWHLWFKDVFDKGGFDIVIGNPPYLRIQGIRKDNPSMADALSQNYKSATGSFDLYVLFVEQAFGLLKSNALANYIMPVKWTNAAFGQGLRNLVLKDGYVSKIISFGAYQVFNVSTYTGIQWFKKNQKELLFKELDKDINTNDELGKYLSSIDTNSFSRIKINELNSESWVLTDSIKAKLLNKINLQPSTLKDVFSKIFQGIATSSDRIYVLKLIKEKSKTYLCFSNSLNSEVEIEKGIVKPFLMGKDVKRYETPIVKNVVIFPYDISDKSNPVLMTLDFIKTNYPMGFKYLIQNKEGLEERESGRMKNEKFYAYIYPKNLTDFASKKILTAEIANKGEMTIDADGYYYHTTKVYSLTLKNNLPESISYYLGILNSKILFFFLSSTGYVLRGGYFTFKTDYLNPFPVKRIDFNKGVEKVLHDNIVKLVTVIIENRNNSKITIAYENKIDALVFHLYNLTESEMLQVLDTFKDMSIKDRNQIQNEYWNIGNNKFKTEA